MIINGGIQKLSHPQVLVKFETGTFSINYNYINYKEEDLGDSSDKYRIDETFINVINLGFITNL